MFLKPHITEKTIKAAATKRYTFEVAKGFNKTQIKKAVEKMFNVKVLGVQTTMVRGKMYRTGKKWMQRKAADSKKAIVRILPSQKIDLFEAGEEPKTK